MVPAVSEIWWEIKKAPQINDLQGYISKAAPLMMNDVVMTNMGRRSNYYHALVLQLVPIIL